MSDRSARLRVIIQMSAPLVGMGLLVTILLWSASTLSDADLTLNSIDTALVELHALEARFDAQIASVGINLAAGSDESLAAYRDVAAMDTAFTKVRDLVASNPGQRARIESTRDKYRSWRKFADSEINQVLAGRSQLGALRRSGESLESGIHDAFTVLGDVERQLQTDWTERAATARHRLVLVILLGGVALAVGLSVVGTRQLSAAAAEDASKYQRLADEHSDTVRQFGQVRTELGDLRRLVRERTASLNAVTGQLEALAYAVSRHLRRRLEQAETLLRDVWYDSLLDDEVDRDALHQLAHEVSSAQQLQEALLTYARLTRVELAVDRIGLNDVLDAVQQDLHPEISRAQAQVTVAPRLPDVQGNRVVLMQIFSHLLSNAVRSGADGPRIKVWALPAEGTVRVWVEDNGIGIAPNDQERIFKLFERVRSDNNDQGGIGIGLAIVRLAAERLGGRVGVESALGQGSRFWIELPLAS